jgi:hypothetical protein
MAQRSRVHTLSIFRMRAEVVDAIVDAFRCGDPSAMPAGATLLERARADTIIEAIIAAEGGGRPEQRALQAMVSVYRSGDDWDDLFGRMTPGEIDSLRALFPYMPRQAARHFAERFVIPSR